MISLRRLVALLALAAVAVVIAGGLYVLRNRPVDVTIAASENDVPIQVFGIGTVEARVITGIGF